VSIQTYRHTVCNTLPIYQVWSKYVPVDLCLSWLLLLLTAGGSDDNLASVCHELDQLRESTDKSLDQSLVRRGEMTPFGTLMNNITEVRLLILVLLVVFSWLSSPPSLEIGLGSPREESSGTVDTVLETTVSKHWRMQKVFHVQHHISGSISAIPRRSRPASSTNYLSSVVADMS